MIYIYIFMNSEFGIIQIDRLIKILNKSLKQIDFIEKLNKYGGSADINDEIRDKFDKLTSDVTPIQLDTKNLNEINQNLSILKDKINNFLSYLIEVKENIQEQPIKLNEEIDKMQTEIDKISNMLKTPINVGGAIELDTNKNIQNIRETMIKIKDMMKSNTGHSLINGKLTNLDSNYKILTERLLKILKIFEENSTKNDITGVNDELNKILESINNLSDAIKMGGGGDTILLPLEYQL